MAPASLCAARFDDWRSRGSIRPGPNTPDCPATFPYSLSRDLLAEMGESAAKRRARHPNDAGKRQGEFQDQKDRAGDRKRANAECCYDGHVRWSVQAETRENDAQPENE